MALIFCLYPQNFGPIRRETAPVREDGFTNLTAFIVWWFLLRVWVPSCQVGKEDLAAVGHCIPSTLNSKREYTLWVSIGKCSKPTSCRTQERVWGIAHWSSTPNKTEFLKKFQVVPKFWIKVWGYALYQPVKQKSMAETDFCELSHTTPQQTFP